ncbi:MAG: MBL fold metallo-hydrolase [Myxococcota bacterium]|nr:MBL fold metallo-hydrolase [Myxococcota bacterium]
MKNAHRPDVFGWSRFDEARNVDFHGWAWLRAGGPGVLIDPLPLSEHDAAQIEAHGPVSHVVVTNSDHTRDAAALAARWGAEIVGPRAERGAFEAHRWVDTGDEIAPGLYAIALEGSKTPGELALLLEGTTLFCGDLIRGHHGGRLNLLPDAKLSDPEAARASVRGLLDYKMVEAVLVGDGWPVFRDGHARLRELCG